MGFTQPRAKDSVNPVPTKRSGVTDLYHGGSRLKCIKTSFDWMMQLILPKVYSLQI